MDLAKEFEENCIFFFFFSSSNVTRYNHLLRGRIGRGRDPLPGIAPSSLYLRVSATLYEINAQPPVQRYSAVSKPSLVFYKRAGVSRDEHDQNAWNTSVAKHFI